MEVNWVELGLAVFGTVMSYFAGKYQGINKQRKQIRGKKNNA